jgi:hypothetical protein
VITSDECADRMLRIWDAIDHLQRMDERSFTAAHALQFQVLAEQFDLLDSMRWCLEMGVPAHELPIVVSMLSS